MIGPKQFKLVPEELALWLDSRRAALSEPGAVACHSIGSCWRSFRQRYWDYYKQLRHLPASANPGSKRHRCEINFDELFSTVTGYDVLDERIARTKPTQGEPAHGAWTIRRFPCSNNRGGVGCALTRPQARGKLRSPFGNGCPAWDTMETLLGTAKKLGVNFFHYIRDRVSGAKQMPALADLIDQRARTANLSPSWGGGT